MKPKRSLWFVLAAMALVGTPLSPMACSGGASGGKTASVTPGEMPQDGTWTGVWYSELYGYLHIVQDGNAVVGKWIRPHKDRWGQLKGEATGDVLKFEWTEHVVDLVGPNATKTGRGYFKYKRPPGENVDDTFAGETGFGKDEVGYTWEAVKQRNVKPDLDSIGGNGAAEVGGGEWDGENTEQGNPEEPTSPN
ncbi:MAG: hypothetical protein IPM54_04235 [Polyangiaceae bacterium]|nr:hypothetical protein [Polyangiaceae bacterium]